MLLDPERPGRGGSEPSLRLWKALHDVLHNAHRLATDLGTTVGAQLVDVVQPPELSVEESFLFRAAVEHYDEAFGEVEADLDRRCGDVISRPSSCGRYQLTAMANLLFRRPGSPIEIRRVKITSRPVDTGRVNPADVALAALLRSPRETSDVVAVVHTLWAAGSASVSVTAITSHDVEAFRSTLRERIDRAFSSPEEPTPGWWCGGCPFLLRCPAIPQDSPETLLARVIADVMDVQDGEPVPSGAGRTWALNVDLEPAAAMPDDDEW